MRIRVYIKHSRTADKKWSFSLILGAQLTTPHPKEPTPYEMLHGACLGWTSYSGQALMVDSCKHDPSVSIKHC
jgi:hypothetical protein